MTKYFFIIIIVTFLITACYNPTVTYTPVATPTAQPVLADWRLPGYYRASIPIGWLFVSIYNNGAVYMHLDNTVSSVDFSRNYTLTINNATITTYTGVEPIQWFFQFKDAPYTFEDGNRVLKVGEVILERL